MALSTETHGDVVVAQTPTDLTDERAAALLADVRELIDAGRTRLVLRMDRTEAIDGPGLTALLDVRDEVLDAGGAVSVVGLGGACGDAFRVTRLDRRFETFADLVPAVNAVR